MENHCNDTINEMGNFVIIITLSLAEPFFFLALNVIYSYVGLTRHEKEATYKMFEFSMTRGRYAAGEYLRKMKLKLLKHTSKDTIELISTSSWITCLQCVNSWSVIQYARTHNIIDIYVKMNYNRFIFKAIAMCYNQNVER